MSVDVKQFLKSSYQPVILVFLAFFLMTIVSFYYVSNIVNKQMNLLGIEMITTAEVSVSSNLSETQIAFSNMAQTTDSMIMSGKSNPEILEFLEIVNQSFRQEDSLLPDFMKVYAYVNGEFLDGSGWVPPEDYDPQKRPWYIGAKESDSIYFSDPYLDADSGNTCISFSKVLVNNAEDNKDVLAIDLDLSRITNYMEEQQIANNGYGFVIDDSLRFVGHYEEDLIGRAITDLGGDYIRLAKGFESGQELSAERFTNYDGVDSIGFFRPIFNGWYLGIVTPRSSYFSQVYQLGWVLSILGFILASILSIILMRTRYERMKSIEESNSKSNFLSRMSHEMRTPMNAIIGMTKISKTSSDIEQLRGCIDKIDVSANHLLGVINDVLDISKIESGKFEVSESEFITEKMIHKITNVVEHRIEEKNLHFTIHLDTNVPYSIVSDEQHLIQVITNLLSNAIKFTPDNGKVELILKATELLKNECVLEIEVRDNGIGIDPLSLKKLFQSFEQADNTISRRYGGTGLGLAISKNIVEKMGGTIDVESEVGKGSRFFLTIKVGYGTLKNITLPAQIHWESLRLLVVDDEPEVLAFMQDFSEMVGATCRKALGGLESLRVLDIEESFDLIFIDLNIKGMDSLTLAKQIIDQDNDVAVAIMSSRLEWTKIGNEAEKIGIIGYIEKPLLPSIIVNWITEHLADREMDLSIDSSMSKESENVFLGRNVLVAEDVEINREILFQLLQDTGVSIAFAENGKIAVEMFEAKPSHFDLIFMDIHMPDMDGFEATRQIRSSKHQRGSAIPIVAMTANVYKEDVDRCIKAGMNDHIGKPIDIDEVIFKMKRYL